MKYNTLLKSVEKPGRYTGGEFGQIIKDKASVAARVAFCFPDTYEIGMSNLGVRILYGVLNREQDIWCERCYAPWADMGEKMRQHGIKLPAHESGDPLGVFDFVAFTLQYELSYTNVLYMLSLADIPLLASQRTDDMPIILGGGPCAYNPEPVADFFDIFSIGEGEDALPELTRLYINMKESKKYTKKDFLYAAATQLDGFYVPSLYDVSYNPDGTIASYQPKGEDIPRRVKKRIMTDLDSSYYPKDLVMPYIETVQDRVVVETFRGCIRGCRFCQAGIVYRPAREKSAAVSNEQAKCLYESTGYDEISLSSLSISDYSELGELTDNLLEWTNPAKISLSMPSMRADSFTKELMEKISTVRSSSLTFAPEAGTQRLRDAINKNITEEDLFRACSVAFEAGKNQVKLYFMQGLPTETYEDLDGIAALAKSAVQRWHQTPGRSKGKSLTVTISVSCFVPKAFTPFQWDGQNSLELLRDKQRYIGDKINDRRIKYNWHEAKVSRVEAVFARGDRRLGGALLEAHKAGIIFDGWDEFFDYDKWLAAFDASGIDADFYANREIGEDEILPWEIIDCGVTKDFLLRERHSAYSGNTSPNCREQCLGCGANSFGGERSCCPKK